MTTVAPTTVITHIPSPRTPLSASCTINDTLGTVTPPGNILPIPQTTLSPIHSTHGIAAATNTAVTYLTSPQTLLPASCTFNHIHAISKLPTTAAALPNTNDTNTIPSPTDINSLFTGYLRMIANRPPYETTIQR